jgi:hypothetical protein
VSPYRDFVLKLLLNLLTSIIILARCLLVDYLDSSDNVVSSSRVKRMNFLHNPKPTTSDSSTDYVLIVHANRLAFIIRLGLYLRGF